MSETLCTGCGATVTEQWGSLRDSSGNSCCPKTPTGSHSLELPSTRLGSGDCPATTLNFMCTLGKGHSERHEAGGSEPLFTWESESAELPPVAIKPENNWVIVADGEGAVARLISEDSLHEEVHRFLCVCGSPWNECKTEGIREDIALIDNLNEWAHDEDGNPFSVSWPHETGKITLYRLELPDLTNSPDSRAYTDLSPLAQAERDRDSYKRQLDAVDAHLPEWKGTGRGRIETIELLMAAVGAKPLHDLFPALIGSELLPEAREAAIEWINLYCEAAELEDHDCPDEDFRHCPVCDQMNEIDHRAFSVAAVWQKHWAAGILRAFDMLEALQEIVALPADSLRIKLVAQLAISKAEDFMEEARRTR